jgi:hypothetical protein
MAMTKEKIEVVLSALYLILCGFAFCIIALGHAHYPKTGLIIFGLGALVNICKLIRMTK